jgi:SsrA-binding protein
VKKKRTPSGKITNRRARYDYQLEDELVVGLELTGAEVKSLRMGHGHLRGAYVTVKDDELWLLNATITGTSGAPIDESNKVRTRRLLAKRREIDGFIAAKQRGRSIVPIELLTRGRFIKLKLAVGKGKKLYDKRQSLKTRDESRRISQELARRKNLT